MTTKNHKPMAKSSLTVGVISDTHGLLRPEVLKTFQGVELILHAGDIGGDDILEELQAIAPVLAVRGNMDYGAWVSDIPASRAVKIGSKRFFLVHDPAHIDVDPAEGKFHAVIFGHTHRPHVETQEGVLLLNPGSAGHRRKDYPISLAILKIQGDRMEAEVIELSCSR